MGVAFTISKINMKQQLPNYLLPDKPIAFNRDYVRIGCGIKGSLMLSQAVYWSKRTTSDDETFWKTQKEWEEETGMTRNEQMSALKILKKLKFIKVFKRGIPAKNHYLVNVNNIIDALSKDHKWSRKSTTSSRETNITSGRESRPHSITENTTEITSDIVDPLTKKTEKFIKELKEIFKDSSISTKQVEEFKKFVSYWTEPNKSRTKIRWELERTWDMKRRIGNWMRNCEKFSSESKNNKYKAKML
jgi:hypothetical protein